MIQRTERVDRDKLQHPELSFWADLQQNISGQSTLFVLYKLVIYNKRFS